MPEGSPQPVGPAPGLRAALDGLKIQAARYVGARLALMRIEAAEAGADAGARAKALAVGAVCCLAGYLLLLAGLIGLAEMYWPGSWPVAALIAAALHLLVGIPFLLKAARGSTKPWFQESLDQIKEDEQWMRTLSPRSDQNPPKP